MYLLEFLTIPYPQLEFLGVNPEQIATQVFLLEFISDIYPEQPKKV
jgi:hypothetical protein